MLGNLRDNTMDTKSIVDEEHMLIHRDNPEERGRVSNQLVAGTVAEAQSKQSKPGPLW